MREIGPVGTLQTPHSSDSRGVSAAGLHATSLCFGLLVPLLGLAGCQDTLRPAENEPRIMVAPERLVVGPAGTLTGESAELRILNVGSSTLAISDISVETNAEEVALADPAPTALAIEPGGEEVLILSSRTDATSFFEELVFSTNDPVEPLVRVPIETRPSPSLTFSPAVIEFGVVETGTSAIVGATLQNEGEVPSSFAKYRLRPTPRLNPMCRRCSLTPRSTQSASPSSDRAARTRVTWRVLSSSSSTHLKRSTNTKARSVWSMTRLVTLNPLPQREHHGGLLAHPRRRVGARMPSLRTRGLDPR